MIEESTNEMSELGISRPKIACYFDASGIGPWSWGGFQDGRVPLSGTHKLNLWLPLCLAKLGWQVLFLTNNMASDDVPNLKMCYADDLVDALLQLRQEPHDVLFFGNTGNAVTAKALGILAGGWSSPVVMSVMNGPPPNICSLSAKVDGLTIVCVSNCHADGLRDQPREFFKKVQVVYAGGVDAIAEDLLAFWQQKDPLHVCYVGSLVYEKGFHLLAGVWPAIRARFPHARLSVVGSGQLYNRGGELGPWGVASPRYEAVIAEQLGADPATLGITFHGLVAPQAYHQIIDTCSVGVVNPWWKGPIETFCNAAVELQSRGLALVGGNAGGLRETIWNAKSGILVSSEKQLQHAILRLLRNPETAREMGQNALIHAGKFTSQGIFASWERLLTTLIRGDQLVPPAFSWRRAEPKVILREGIRRLRLVPGLDPYIPTLSQIRGRF